MSPSTFQDVPRCSSHLRIQKDSHSIQKPLVGNSSSSSSSRSSAPKNPNPSTKRQPVIIYTHPPKIIHAQARDFMALVQKLTGLDQSGDEKSMKVEPETCNFSEEKEVKNVVGYEENESLSVLTDEKSYMDEYKFHDSSAVSPFYNTMPNQYMGDLPLFSPSSSDFISSSTSESMFQYPNMGNSVSPSFFDYMKGFPDS